MHAIGDYNMKVLVSSRGTILDLKKIVAKTSEKVRKNIFLHIHTCIHAYIHTYIICSLARKIDRESCSWGKN